MIAYDKNNNYFLFVLYLFEFNYYILLFIIKKVYI